MSAATIRTTLAFSALAVIMCAWAGSESATTQPTTLATTSTCADVIPLGKGLTNALYVDADGDGFGPASPSGPDADDADPDINTPPSVLKKRASLNKHLASRGVSGKVYYIGPKGNNSQGRPDQLDKPYATFAKIQGLLQPGDAAVFLEGTYIAEKVIQLRSLRGKTDKPIYILAQPGARVVLDTNDTCIEIDSCRNVVVDGFVCDNSHSKRLGRGVSMKLSRGVTLSNLEIRNHFWGVIGMQDLHDVTIQSCVIHDNPHEHGVYLGSREQPNSSLTVRNCVIYRNGQQGIQHNGRVKKLLLEGNVIHTNAQAGIQLMQGVCDSTIRGNLIFNNAKQGICIYNYDSTDSSIRPFDQTGNVFEDNIVWIGRNDPFDQYPTETYAAVLFNDATNRKGGSFDGNTFRRNVLVTSDGPAFMFRQAKFADKTVVEGNTIFRTGRDGPDRVMLLGEQPLGFERFAKFAPTYKGNVYQNPEFASCRIEDFKTPERFDFRRKTAATTTTTTGTGLNNAHGSQK